MLSNISYRLSTFGDYTQIKYTYPNIQKAMQNLGSESGFMPGEMVQQVPGNVFPEKRIVLTNQSNQDQIVIARERIDVLSTSDKKEGFNSAESEEVYSRQVECMGAVLSSFKDTITAASRLALFITYIYFDIDDKTKREFRERFIKNDFLYEAEYTNDFSFSANARTKTEIVEKPEILNVITNIDNYLVALPDGHSISGYKIDFDINTHQDNRESRFDIAAVRDFYNISEKINVEMKNKVFNIS